MNKENLINKAIVFATYCHQGDIRKGSEENPIPYILHPLEAGVIAASMTCVPEVIVAAILHDVVEDTSVSLEDIKKEFGSLVGFLVAEQSENKRTDKPAEDTWETRKRETIESVKTISKNSKIVMLSDKLSNMRSIKQDYTKLGNKLWDRFNQKDKEKQAWYYMSLRDNLSELEHFEAWKEYNRLVKNVFE